LRKGVDARIKSAQDDNWLIFQYSPAQTRRGRIVLEWAVACDGYPVSRARVRPIIPHRVVLDAAIVPERDRVLGPAEAALEQRVGHVLVEITQHAVALVAWNP